MDKIAETVSEVEAVTDADVDRIRALMLRGVERQEPANDTTTEPLAA